jgi:transcriptional regulator with XRE-family HTH domain
MTELLQAQETRSPDAIDKDFGTRIMKVRTFMGVTRAQLAEKIGITHQQLHKYENGINRVSIGRLVAISQALEMPVTQFFANDELFEPASLENQRLCLEVMRDFQKLRSKEHKDAVRQLIRSLSHNA